MKIMRAAPAVGLVLATVLASTGAEALFGDAASAGVEPGEALAAAIEAAGGAPASARTEEARAAWLARRDDLRALLRDHPRAGEAIARYETAAVLVVAHRDAAAILVEHPTTAQRIAEHAAAALALARHPRLKDIARGNRGILARISEHPEAARALGDHPEWDYLSRTDSVAAGRVRRARRTGGGISIETR